MRETSGEETGGRSWSPAAGVVGVVLDVHATSTTPAMRVIVMTTAQRRGEGDRGKGAVLSQDSVY